MQRFYWLAMARCQRAIESTTDALSFVMRSADIARPLVFGVQTILRKKQNTCEMYTLVKGASACSNSNLFGFFPFGFLVGRLEVPLRDYFGRVLFQTSLLFIHSGRN